MILTHGAHNELTDSKLLSTKVTANPTNKLVLEPPPLPPPSSSLIQFFCQSLQPHCYAHDTTHLPTLVLTKRQTSQKTNPRGRARTHTHTHKQTNDKKTNNHNNKSTTGAAAKIRLWNRKKNKIQKAQGGKELHQVRELDEAFETGVMLDVDFVELNAITPALPGS